ncbi:hypothetical protein PENSPDRAFT_495609 [Peniophora sp. CONT]|nr:hypothetical protein PENSPDRAFT_495609 [Peniophora sp. CONT]
MSSPPDMALPLGSQLPAEIPMSPSAMRRQLLEAGEADLGPTGEPTAALAKHWLDAYSGFVNVYMNPLLNPEDDVWLPPRAYILLLEAATVLVLRLKDFRSLFAPKAAKIIPSLLVFYVLLDGYEAIEVPDYDENSSVSGARMQELIFEALVLYLLSLGDRVKPRAKNVGAPEEEDLVLSTILEAFLMASDEILLKRETMLYPCTVPMLSPGRIHTRLDDEEAVPVDHILLRNERQAALLPSFFTSVVAAVLARQCKSSDFLMSTLGVHSARSSRSVFMSLISGCWPVAPAKVADSAALMMSNMHSFASAHNSPLLEDIYSDLRHQLLLYRIGVKDPQPRARLDTVLDTCLYSSHLTSPAAHCLSLLRGLTRADVDDHSLTAVI